MCLGILEYAIERWKTGDSFCLCIEEVSRLEEQGIMGRKPLFSLLITGRNPYLRLKRKIEPFYSNKRHNSFILG